MSIINSLRFSKQHTFLLIIYIKMILGKTFIILIISLELLHYVKLEVFTSLADLEEVLQTEKEIPRLIQSYVKSERHRLEKIKSLAKDFQKTRLLTPENEETFLDNPINIFHLIKRLNIDSQEILYLMNTTTIAKVISTYNKTKKLTFPRNTDFTGVVTGINRLSSVYNLDAKDIAKGELIPGIEATKELTAVDCYDIGQQLFDQQKYLKAIPWFEEAKAREDKTDEYRPLDRESVYEFLAYSYFVVGKNKKAVETLKEYFEDDPENERLLTAYALYENQLNQFGEESTIRIEDKSKEDFEKNFPDEWPYYIQLCQKKDLLVPQDKINLKCYYSRNKSPYLTLQPAKMEDIFHSPWIVIYYDVLNNKEIELIKKLSTPKLRRATIITDEGLSSPAAYRISKSGWLPRADHPDLEKISKKVESLTGLNTLNAEDLQVVNYGIGGQYEPHVDYDDRPDFPVNLMMGNRLATFLFYLTDVEGGGGTVFPQLNVGVQPIKGSAVFWYNLLKTGEVNSMMEHAACPVLHGNKWIANFWIHSFHQEFRRPCAKSSTSIFEESPLQKSDFT